jgi:uncharacterized protein (TIGR03437 family)
MESTRPRPPGARVSILRFSLLTIICLSPFTGATLPDHPLYFEQRSNRLFETRVAGQPASIGTDRIELDGVTLRFLRSSKHAYLEGLGTPAPSSYIRRGQTRNFQAYPKAGIQRLYPGIDVTFYGHAGELEYDLNLAPGAKPDRIRLQLDGARNVRLDEEGNLIVETRSGRLRQLTPRVFQTAHGVRQEIPSHYVLLSANEIGFQLGKHDQTIPLTIDPVIVYTKYYGGRGSDAGGPVATDAQGNVYVTGNTNSVDFPTTTGSAHAHQPPLIAFSNAGQTATPLPVDSQVSVTAIGGTSDGKVLYVATPDGIFVSGNHGASFVQGAPLAGPYGAPPVAPVVQAISVDAIDPSRAFIATTSGLFIMSSAGLFTGQNQQGLADSGSGAVNVSSVQISPVDHLIAYASTASPNLFYKSTDGGGSWQQLNPAYPGEPAPGPYNFNSITFTLTPGGSDLYLIDANAILLKSADGGSTWQQLAGNLYAPKSITIDPNNPSNIYVLDSVGVQMSTNGGVSFTTITPPFQGGVLVQAFALDSSTGDLYFATYNQIEVSVDHGATWKMLPPRLNPYVLIGLGNQVFAGVDSPSVPFVVKWSPDGSKMLYSTFFGGSFSDQITAVTVDPQGEAIIAGTTSSSDFPVTQTISPASGSPVPATNGFVAKLSADGSQAIYSSLLGASKGVTISSLAIDSSGAPYITGSTQSPDFPTTANVPQPKLPTTMCQRNSTNPFQPIGDLAMSGFVSKLNVAASSLVYSSFITGSCGSTGQGIAVDAAGEAVVVGTTTSPDFPVTANAYQTTFPGGAAASIIYPNPVSFGFVSKLSAAGDKLIASSFIGGGFFTEANALALDSSGDAYITGGTWGITPGATPGAYQTKVDSGCPPVFSIGPGPEYPTGGSDAYVLKLDPALSTAQYLTYLGGICDDAGSSIVLEPSGNVWVAGTGSQGFPLVTPYQLSGDFVSEFNPDLSQLLFSSFGDGANLAIDPTGSIYVSGTALYPTSVPKNGGYGSGNSASLVKIDPTNAPPVIVNSIGPTASAVAFPPEFSYGIAPGELISITGQHLGPSATVMAQLDATGRLPFQVDATSVAFDGYIAPLISVQDGLIVAFAPFEITGTSDVTVTVDGQKSNSVRIVVTPYAPYFLAITNQDGTANSASHPAPQGSVVTFYLTGFGVTSPLSQDGSVNAAPLPVPVLPINAYINETQVQPQYVASADGLVAGITQVNLQIPVGTYTSNPVTIYIGGAVGPIYVGQ